MRGVNQFGVPVMRFNLADLLLCIAVMAVIIRAFATGESDAVEWLLWQQ